MKAIVDQLRKSKTVLIASHTHPDGDAVGALLAMGLALKSMHKQVRMYNESPIPAVYRFLPSVSSIMQQTGAIDSYDSVVIMDCGTIERVGAAADDFKKAAILINIDHHVTNTGFGNLRLIDTKACATAEIIYRLIESLPVQIDSVMATAIYTGILSDTGSFRFSNTNKQAFAICSKMIDYGADPYEVAQYVYGTYSLGRIKLLNLALDSLEIAFNGKLSVMTLTRRMLTETGTQPEDIDGIINYARRIEDIKVAALIHEISSTGKDSFSESSDYHVSLRSDGYVDVAKIAAQFGGGGHSSAAGFSVEKITLTELKKTIFNWTVTIPGLRELD
ncbi:MAG: bifunctional oligoribonuclease/PAP phosphatase NrnA [Desulfobacteraceae bacterium]|nr:bifunctional oligoribonuclease/PAP phosphatase NrnA [Desulfobacteraceae bacterium]